MTTICIGLQDGFGSIRINLHCTTIWSQVLGTRVQRQLAVIITRIHISRSHVIATSSLITAGETSLPLHLPTSAELSKVPISTHHLIELWKRRKKSVCLKPLISNAQKSAQKITASFWKIKSMKPRKSRVQRISQNRGRWTQFHRGKILRQ